MKPINMLLFASHLSTKKVATLAMLVCSFCTSVFALPQVNFETSSATVFQNSGAVQLKLVLSNAINSDAVPQVVYSVIDGTAVRNHEYSSSYYAFSESNYGGLIQFQNGSAEAYITIPILYTGSTVTKSFSVALSSSSSRTKNVTVGPNSSFVVTILGENNKPPMTFALGAASFKISQSAGAIQIPVYYTGLPSDNDVWVDYHTQAGTANGYDDYEGTSSARLDFPPGSTSAFITIPIYETGSSANKFFNVVLDESSEGQLGSPAAALVTILGKGQTSVVPDSFDSSDARVKIRTRSVRRGHFTIYGSVTGVSASAIRRVTMTIGSNRISIRGKKHWSARVVARSSGSFVMVVHAYLNDGGVATKRARLHVRR